MAIDTTDGVLSTLFSTPEMDSVFSGAGQVQQRVRFEWALSAALEDCGLAPPHTSQPLDALLEMVLAEIPSVTVHLSPDVLHQLLTSANYLGSTPGLIARTLKSLERDGG